MLGHIQISAVKPRVQYVGDGTRSQFFFPFPVFLAENLEVYLGSVRQTTGFVARGVGESDGGSVTFASPPASGVLVTLRRNLAIQRLTDFQDSGQFRAKVLNDELDHLTATVQQLDAEAGRTIRLNPTDSDSSLILPEASKRAGHTIVFDERGDLTTRPSTIGPSSAWQTLDDIPEGGLHRHFSDAERNKLSGIAGGAEVNPAPVTEAEKAAATETAPRSFSPRDVRDIAALHVDRGDITIASVHGRTGAVTAQAGDYTAEQIADTATKVIMTAEERGKLAAVEPGAEVNAVASVHGRSGAVTAQAGDYTAEQITDTATKVIMTAEERGKLAAIDPGAPNQPPQVSVSEKASGTLKEIRSFSPNDIAEMIAALGRSSDGIGEVDGGHSATIFNAFIDGGLAGA